MTFDEFRADFLIMLEYQNETLSIDLHLGYLKMMNRGYDKYKDFTPNQLLLIRNNLHGKINKIGNNLNGYIGTTRDSR